MQNNVVVKQVLAGHVSEETAYVVDDYPYGFRLRTQIRYWIETRKGYGQRFCSQTLNPKTGRWNKPKKGNYSVVMAMYINEEGHVDYEVLSSGGWDKEDGIQEFERLFADAIGEYEKSAIRYIRASNKVNDSITWTIKPASQDSEPQSREEQACIINALIRSEYAKADKG